MTANELALLLSVARAVVANFDTPYYVRHEIQELMAAVAANFEPPQDD